MTSSNGHVDVICTSSLIQQDLVANGWLKSIDYRGKVDNLSRVSVDFLNLPYDKKTEYSVPLFWNLYGWLLKEKNHAPTATELLHSRNWTSLAPELVLVSLLSELTPEGAIPSWPPSISSPAKSWDPRFLANDTRVHLSLLQAEEIIKTHSALRFELSEKTSFLDVGILAIGSQSQDVGAAIEFIHWAFDEANMNRLYDTLPVGSVINSHNHDPRFPNPRRPDHLRDFSLSLMSFPDIKVEAIPQYRKFFSETSVSGLINSGN